MCSIRGISKDAYKQMECRLKICVLEFAKDKTRLIEFGIFVSNNRKNQGMGKQEIFDFLGFTHCCSSSYKTGRFRLKRKTSKKKFKQKVQEFKIWIKENRNRPLKEIIPTIRRKLIGHYNYYGVLIMQKD